MEGQEGGVLQHASPPDTTFQQQRTAGGWQFSGWGLSSTPRHQQTTTQLPWAPTVNILEGLRTAVAADLQDPKSG